LSGAPYIAKKRNKRKSAAIWNRQRSSRSKGSASSGGLEHSTINDLKDMHATLLHYKYYDNFPAVPSVKSVITASISDGKQVELTLEK
jgi:hypothetical protein